MTVRKETKVAALPGLAKRVEEWHMVQDWREALGRFAIRWPERVEQALAS